MTTNNPGEVPLPVLLRHARSTYGTAMRAALAKAGCDDIPKNGLYVIGGLALETMQVPLSQLIAELRISKQAAGQLVDALVIRGYIDRNVDGGDRRRLTVTLTERGRMAATVQAEARQQVDAALVARVGEEHIRHARETLSALIDIGSQTQGADEGE
jgi:DNA-binding MarR family transcriptional regulator